MNPDYSGDMADQYYDDHILADMGGSLKKSEPVTMVRPQNVEVAPIVKNSTPVVKARVVTP